jgi:hypothetical protein
MHAIGTGRMKLDSFYLFYLRSHNWLVYTVYTVKHMSFTCERAL